MILRIAANAWPLSGTTHLLPHMCRRCRCPPAAPQTSKGVVFGTYMIKVDTIAAARTTRAEMSQIWKAVQTKFVPEDQVRGGEWCDRH